MTDDRDADWYDDRLPTTQALDLLLDQTPEELLAQGTRDRVIANANVDVVQRLTAALPEATALLATAQALARRKRDTGALGALTAQEKRALDLFLFVTARPALYVRGGALGLAPVNWPELDASAAAVQAVIAAVGRVEDPRGGHGTGFLLGPTAVLTNNHVAWGLVREPGDPPFPEWEAHFELYQRRVRETRARWEAPATRPLFRTQVEASGPPGPALPVRAVVACRRDADYALLELARPAEVKPLTVQRTAPAPVEKRKVYLVGHPGAPPSTTPAAWVENVFAPAQGGHGFQRVSPGLLTRLVSPRELRHDASTLGGSSGSAVVDLQTHRVLGIHYGGSQQAMFNQCVPLWLRLGDAELAFLSK